MKFAAVGCIVTSIKFRISFLFFILSLFSCDVKEEGLRKQLCFKRLITLLIHRSRRLSFIFSDYAYCEVDFERKLWQTKFKKRPYMLPFQVNIVDCDCANFV